jgi:hypothetical protein
MRSLVLVVAIYVALTASFIGRAAEPAHGSKAPAATSPAGEAGHGGLSHPLSLGRALWVPAGSPAPSLERSTSLRRWTPAAPAPALSTLLAAVE